MSTEIDRLRWIEIQFYYMCSDILKIRNNWLDVLDLIDALVFLGNYNSEKIKATAQEALQAMRIRPIRDEVIILGHKFGAPIGSIKKRLGLHNRTIYAVINNTEERYFYPRFRTDQTEEIEKFIRTLEQFREVGI